MFFVKLDLRVFQACLSSEITSACFFFFGLENIFLFTKQWWW